MSSTAQQQQFQNHYALLQYTVSLSGITVSILELLFQTMDIIISDVNLSVGASDDLEFPPKRTGMKTLLPKIACDAIAGQNNALVPSKHKFITSYNANQKKVLRLSVPLEEDDENMDESFAVKKPRALKQVKKMRPSLKVNINKQKVCLWPFNHDFKFDIIP